MPDDATDEKDLVPRGILHPEGMRAAQELSRGLVHEINNILGVVIGNAHLADKHREDSDAVARYAEEVRDAAEQGRAIMRQLAALATDRAQDGHAGPPVALNDVARQIQAIIGDSVSLLLSDGNPLVNVDLWLLQTTLAEAARIMAATPLVSEVRIRTDATSNEIRISLEDDGPAPTRDEIEGLFAPFARLADRPRLGLEWTKVAYLALMAGGTASADGSPLGGVRISVALPCGETLA